MSSSAHFESLVWLLEGDPAIRWQTQRDLLGEPREVWEAERGLVPTNGWGMRLLSHRDQDGKWGGGTYSPKWTSTTYTLLLLKDMGLSPQHPAGRLGARIMLDGHLGPLNHTRFQTRLEHEDL